MLRGRNGLNVWARGTGRLNVLSANYSKYGGRRKRNMTDKRMTEMTDTIINVIRARHENFADHQQNDHAYKDFRACKDRATLLAILDEVAELPRQVAGDDVSRFIWCDELDAILERR
jgi:hypothetical protein